MATPCIDRSTELTPSLEKLNSTTPMPLLGVAGVTDEDRRAARKARLEYWNGQCHDVLGYYWGLSLEAEPSVASFAATVPVEVGDAADTAILGLPSGEILPHDWNETFRQIHSAICGLLDPWAEAPVRAIVREDLGESRLAAVADFFDEREAVIAAAYRAAGKRPMAVETLWDRWDVRRSIFDHVVMLEVCQGRRLPASVGRADALALMKGARRLFPEAYLPDFEDALAQAARFTVGNFSQIRERVEEVEGVGFHVERDRSGGIEAASPGRVQVRPVNSGCAIELSFPGREAFAAELPNREWMTDRLMFERLAFAGAPVSQKLIADCLRGGLWGRIRTAAAGGGLHGF